MKNIKKFIFGTSLLTSAFVTFAAYKCQRCCKLFPQVEGRIWSCLNCGSRNIHECHGSDAALFDFKADLKKFESELAFYDDKCLEWLDWELRSLFAYVKDVHGENMDVDSEELCARYFSTHNHEFGFNAYAPRNQ